jgi:CheY-like chemotaxis protein
MITLKHIESLYLEAMNASKMLDNVITHGSGAGDHPYDVVDVNTLLTQTISLFGYQLKTRGVVLDTLLAEGALPVKGNSFVLQQAFYIALLNAVQIQINSRDDRKIALSSRIDGDSVRIDISLVSPVPVMLTGEDLLTQFFESLDKGMGMGWYTLKKNIARYGGTVAVAGGNHFTFSIELPCAVPETGTEAASTRPSVQPSVLIIDDEVMTAEVTAEMMAHLGFETVCVHDPMASLPLLRDRRFDLVLVDNQMPKMKGVTFIREYASLLRDSCVALMSGDASVDISGIAGRRSVSLLKKPFALKELKCLAREMKK